MTQHLSIDAILAVADLPTKVVDMPEWGGTVLVRGLSKGAYDDLRAATSDDPAAIEVSMLVACVAEPALTAEQATKLRYKSLAAYKRLHDAIGEVNRIESAKDTKSVAGGESGDEVPAALGAGPGEDAGGASEGAAG